MQLFGPKNDLCLISPYSTPWNQTLRSQERGNYHQLKQLLIVKEILLASTL